jgi:nucleoside-diphosphate kinase
MTTSTMERTCILVKPDAVCNNLTGTVLARFAKAGLILRAAKMFKISASQAETFYGEHKGKPFYEPLIRFMTSAPIVATVWEGEGAIAKARSVMGATNSPEAAPGTLRREFGTNNRYNVVHGSDSQTSAEREIRFFFTPEEIYQYQENDWKV